MSAMPTGSVANWRAVIAAALATFSVVTTEMLPVGLLTPIADSLAASTGGAAWLISLPALVAAVCAPLLVLLAGGVDRRHLLCGLLALLTVANVASAVASTLMVLLGARALVGLCMGGIWAIAGSLAVRLVPAPSQGMATSLIFGGVAAASVLGVPLGALAGELLGWRWAFALMAGFSALVLLLHVGGMPPLPARQTRAWPQFVALRRNRGLHAGLLLTLLMVGAHFAGFTFVRPILVELANVPPAWLSGLLFAYGLAGIAGNFVAGLLAARAPKPTVVGIAALLMLALVLLRVAGDGPMRGAVLLVLWGLAYGGVSVALMTWVIKAAPQAMEAASALYVSVFNIGIGAGAWLGGSLADAHGAGAPLWAGIALAAGCLFAALGLRRPSPH